MVVMICLAAPETSVPLRKGLFSPAQALIEFDQAVEGALKLWVSVEFEVG